MQVVFELFGHVNGCGHLSGLFVRRFRCRGPVWRYAVQFHITLAGFVSRCEFLVLLNPIFPIIFPYSQRPPHIPNVPTTKALKRQRWPDLCNLHFSPAWPTPSAPFCSRALLRLPCVVSFQAFCAATSLQERPFEPPLSQRTWHQ